MESESSTNNTKISDSGYSNSCSNTTSQGSASSKSRHSGGSNSSRSSGYGGAPKQNESDESGHSPGSKRNKEREHKKKKQKPSNALAVPTLATIPQDFTVPTEASSTISTVAATIGAEVPPSPTDLASTVPEHAETKATHVDMNINPFVPEDVGVLEIVAPIAEEKALVLPVTENQIIENGDEWIRTDGDVPQSEVMASSQPEVNEGFCCVISMYDGVVLYTTPSVTSVLGFPKDMLVGHSFIDFIHPKDRDTFSTHISASVALPLVDCQGKVKDVRNYLYVCLRRHKAPVGVSFVEKPASYQAFHLTVTIKKMAESSESHLCDNNNGLFLVILAVPVYSAYKVPGERKTLNKFGMRHTATCIFSYVDPDVVTNFGFLPQDMLGKSVFDFYHPEDMPFLKEVYKSVMKTSQVNGSVFRSKPYRFLVHNGCFAMIETEWSSVVNPWSRRLEFVISLHQVLQGPSNPDVFDVASDKEFKTIPEEAIKRGKLLQGEIIQLLTQELPRPTELGKQQVSKRCKDLANFMESLMNTSKLEIDVPQESNPSVSERFSVMLGEVSPHDEFYDSKSSSETPPSYNQLNYNENLTRFFQSNPKTTVTSDGSNSASNGMEIDGKNSQECAPNNQKCLSPLQNSGASGSSAGNLSSSSNPNMESGTTSGTNTSNDEFKPAQLTAKILVKHNEDMEKIMVQRHKKERWHIKDREAKKSHKKLQKHTNNMLGDVNMKNHGIKRSGSQSWEDDCHKVSKHYHQNLHFEIVNENGSNNNGKNVSEENLRQPQLPSNACLNENIWPPFSVAVPTNPQISSPLTMTANNSYGTNMLPVYYLPTFVQPRVVSSDMDHPQRYQVQYMPPGLVYNYNPIFLPQPVFCSTVPVVSLPLQNSSPSGCPNGAHFVSTITPPRVNPGSRDFPGSDQPGHNNLQSDQYHQCDNTLGGSNLLSQCNRPSSQATSVKAEPGSRIGSIASASVVNKNMEPTKQPQQVDNAYRQNRMDEESSCYSSSYSSLLKTDTCSGSNDDSTSNNNTNRTDDEMIKQRQKVHPMRKKDPPWIESVAISPHLVYKYQMAVKDLDEILKMDLNTLQKTEQPIMVNDQLHQLYIEMELEGLSKALTLEEGFSSSSSSSDDTPSNGSRTNVQGKSKKRRSYSSLMMIYEDDAPFPPPEANS